MSGIPLDTDLLKGLLAKQAPTGGYPPPEQHGPLRWVEKEHRCASRGCGSPTHCKVQGIPRCSMHALRMLNDMLHELGVAA